MSKRVSSQASRSRRSQILGRAASIELLEQRTLLSIAFGSPVEYDSMRGSVAIASADFNGDGKADIVVVGSAQLGGRESTGSAAVAVELNNGDGTFAAPSFLAASGNSAQSVVTADFNHDGKMDIGVACPGGNVVDVYLGNGDGTFRSAVSTPLAFSSAELAGNGMVATDLNHDGNPDLLIADAGRVDVLMGNGDGTFRAGTAVAVGDGGTFGYMRIAAGDFNGDGKTDLAAVINGNSNVFIANGDGAGGFSTTLSTYAVSTDAINIVAADVNGDGRTDLIVPMLGQTAGNTTTGAIQVLLNTGSGFSSGALIANSGGQPLIAYDLAAADFDGDGKLDLIANDGQGGLSVMPGDGDGTFQTVQHIAAVDNVGPHFQLIAADFNGDGKLDLADLTYPEAGTSGGMEIMIQGAPRTIRIVVPSPVQPPVLPPVQVQPPVIIYNGPTPIGGFAYPGAIPAPVGTFIPSPTAGKLLSKKIHPAVSATKPQVGTANQVNATAGELTNAVLGSFNAPSSTTSASQLTANINWGDGHTSVGQLDMPKAGQFSAYDSYTYAKPGKYKVTVDVMEGSTEVAMIHTRAIVTQNSAAGRTVHAVAGHAFNGVVALYDTRIKSPATTGFGGQIAWGDGSTDSTTLKKKNGRWDLVIGTHTYANPGTYRISVAFTLAPAPGAPGTVTPDFIIIEDQEFSTAIVR